MIIPMDSRNTYEDGVRILRDLSRGYYNDKDYEEILGRRLDANIAFRRFFLTEIEEYLEFRRVPFEVQKDCFEMCLNYGLVEAIKLLVAKNPRLLNEKYGTPAVSVSDFMHRVISSYQEKELFDKHEFTAISAGLKETFDYFTKTCNIRITPALVEAQVVEGLNPRESAENKAVLVSVQNSIENLLKKYRYLDAMIEPPSKAPPYTAFKSWVADLKRMRGQEPMVQEAVESFEAVLEAKTDTVHYMEAAEKNRKTLYGAYRFVVRKTKEKFTMQDIFALIWQTIQTEVPYMERQEYLESWLLTMQEAAHAHEEGKNPVVGFEETTHGCSNAMINPSIAILAGIDGLSRTGIVQVNYANPHTMREKAFHGFFADKIEEQWNKAGLVDRIKLRRQLEHWVANPYEGIPDAIYTEEVKAYIAEQLKEEYKNLMSESELKHNTEDIIENITYRGFLPWRLKRLLMQDFVKDFVEQRNLGVAVLKKVLVETKLKKATPEGVWGTKSAFWTDFVKNKFIALRLSRAEKESYKDVALDAIRKTLLKLVAETGSSSGGASAGPATADKKMPVATRVSVTEKTTIASAAKSKKIPITSSVVTRSAAAKGKNTGT